MYGPIANLPGYNPDATYLPPGFALPSSYPERAAPTQKFYDMPPLPHVAPQNQYEFNGADPDSIGPTAGITAPTAQGWPGQVWGDTNFYDLAGMYNNTSAPQRANPRTLSPANIQPNGLSESDIYQLSQLPSLPGFDMGAFVQSQPRQVATVSAQEGDQLYGGTPQTYGGFPQSMGGYGLPTLDSLANSNGVINTYSTTSQPSIFSSRWFDSLTNLPSDFQFSNAVHAGLNAFGLPGTLASAGLGALGWGGADTGNPALNQIAQAPFGMGTNNLPRLPEGSQVMTDRGATAFDPSMYSTEGMTAAEKSAAQAYGNPSVYDTTGKGWLSGAPAPSYNWSDASNDFMQGATFGAGRFDAGGSGFMPSDWQINQGMMDNYQPQSYSQLSMSPIMAIDPNASWFAPPELGNPNYYDDQAMFGPMARYTQGNRDDTN